MPAALQTLPLLLFPALVITAAVKDIASYTIPNWISAVLIVAFFLAALAVGAPLGLIGLNFAVGLGGLAIGVAMFALGWIGGGDAKLFAAACLWLGLQALMTFILATAIAGAALALILLGLRMQLVRAHTPSAPWLDRLTTPGAPAPYGVAIAIGAILAFPESALAGLAHLVLPFRL